MSPEYEEVAPNIPKARGASFLKDKTISLLSGATPQMYFGPVNTSTIKEGEEDLDDIVPVGTPEVTLEETMGLLSGATVQSYLDLQRQQRDSEDGIVCVGKTPEVASVSGDFLPLFMSGSQVGLKGYDPMPFDSELVSTSTIQEGQEDFGTPKVTSGSSNVLEDVSGRVRTLFQSLSPSSFVNGQSDGDSVTTVSVSDEFATQTDVRIGFVGNIDYKHPVDENGCGQRLGGLTKWINHVTRDGFCMKVSESSGDW